MKENLKFFVQKATYQDISRPELRLLMASSMGHPTDINIDKKLKAIDDIIQALMFMSQKIKNSY